MNIGYLYSIIELYQEKENQNRKTNLVIKKSDGKISFNFNMSKSDSNKTIVDIYQDVFNENLSRLLNKYKDNQLIIDEKYDTVDKQSLYEIYFKNGRIISFIGFTLVELNSFRNILYNIKFETDKIRIEQEPEEPIVQYQNHLSLQPTGFASFFTILAITIFLAVIFIIVLWLCKIFMN